MDLRKEKHAVVRVVLFTHFMRDDMDVLEGTEYFSQQLKNQTNRLVSYAEIKFQHTAPKLFHNKAAVDTSMEYWKALEKIAKFLSSLEMENLIAYAESLDELIELTQEA